MAVVTKINRAKKWRCKTRSFQKTIKWLKTHAHRAYRHNAKINVRLGMDVNEKPRLTAWDIV